MFDATKKIKPIIFPRRRPPSALIERNYHEFSVIGNGIPILQLESDFDPNNVDLLVKIFYSHGNGEDLGCIRGYLEELVNEILPSRIQRDKSVSVGYALWAWEYPSYGESHKHFNLLDEESILEDAVEACSIFHNTNVLGSDTAKCETINIVLGYSLGCVPSVYLASRSETIHACVLLAPFANLKSVVPWYLSPFVGMCRFQFANDVWVTGAKCPVYTTQSSADQVIPYSANNKVFREYSREYIVLEGKSHQWFVRSPGIKYMGHVIEEIIRKEEWIPKP